MTAFKVTVLIFGWFGLLLIGMFILGIFLDGGHGESGAWSVFLAIAWAVAYWPVTLIVLGLGFWASNWWMKQG
ncbi:hypothetical protein [Mesorhizobium abyssinicae]|uniref:hypothetical protein n=1 Tax=Mesorhizobium abyssinicae TaxID=1209958 RepID=UPI0033928AD0